MRCKIQATKPIPASDCVDRGPCSWEPGARRGRRTARLNGQHSCRHRRPLTHPLFALGPARQPRQLDEQTTHAGAHGRARRAGPREVDSLCVFRRLRSPVAATTATAQSRTIPRRGEGVRKSRTPSPPVEVSAHFSASSSSGACQFRGQGRARTPPNRGSSRSGGCGCCPRIRSLLCRGHIPDRS